jgi:hypothetical protein
MLEGKAEVNPDDQHTKMVYFDTHNEYNDEDDESDESGKGRDDQDLHEMQEYLKKKRLK